MVKIGMMIGDRYEILEKIGTGGMSDVYKAKCHKLNRYVAVKVLKQEFSENTSFVAKFRTEAQAAAGLMHANIVNVYDVGEENGIYYIVMELVEGITLKNYIEKKSRLSVKEAVSIAIQIALGIEAAHNNKIIHRDIKPQNVIISKEGRVKVTDFGIAKAATSNTITSNVMGSVHYTSPEQARGGYSDAKSDIYSMGITLYEMLTGKVPFNGETTVSIAIKHIQEDMPSPRNLVPEIPISVEKIVMKCCQKQPERRYQTVGELIEDLKRSLVNPNADLSKSGTGTKPANTLQSPVVKPNTTPKAESTIIKPSPQKKTEMNNAGATQMWDAGVVSGAGKQEPAEDRVRERSKERVTVKKEDRDEDSMERITTTIMVTLVVIIGIVALYFVARVSGFFNSTPQKLDDPINKEEPVNPDNTDNPVKEGNIEVKSVYNYMRNRAVSLLREQGFEVEVAYSESEEIASGYVISQTPEAGTKLLVGETVVITVSTGKTVEEVVIPDIRGLTVDEAMVVLDEYSLLIGNLDELPEEYSDYPVGTISSCNYPLDQNVTVTEGTELIVYISKGPQNRTYSYSLYVNKPDDFWPYGTNRGATVTLTDANGNVLYTSGTIMDFPVSATIYPIKNVSSGYITVVYSIIVTGNNPDGTPFAYQDMKTVQTAVNFTQESE